MGTKKLTAVWHIIKPHRSLASKMKLMLFIRDYYAQIAKGVDDQSLELGEAKTLEAVRSIVNNKIEASTK